MATAGLLGGSSVPEVGDLLLVSTPPELRALTAEQIQRLVDSPELWRFTAGEQELRAADTAAVDREIEVDAVMRLAAVEED